MSIVDRAREDVLTEVANDMPTKGYALIPGVISADLVAAVRNICDQHLVESNEDAPTEIESSKLLLVPELAATIFNPEVTDTLRALIGGPIAFYPNYVVRLNRFTDWHVDNGFVPAYHPSADHLFDPEFRHLQCVIYLQENLPGVGGGLDVVPGSHRWAADGIDPGARDGITPEHQNLFDTYGRAVSVPSRPGDLIAFDGRLLHRGTPIRGALPQRKYGVFFSASRNDDLQVDRYLRYLSQRGDSLRRMGTSDDHYMVRRYDDVLAVKVPDSYLPDTVAYAQDHDIRLAHVPSR